MMKPIKLNIPYPTIENIDKNRKAAAIISPLYAGHHGELNAVLQYTYHYFNFKTEKVEEIANTLMGIAIAEMQHLELLGELLITLGVDPVYTRFPPYKTDFYSTANVCYSRSLQKMILDDLSGEMLAVSEYRRAEKLLDDGKVQAIISRIALDEELHIKVLSDCLHSLR